MMTGFFKRFPEFLQQKTIENILQPLFKARETLILLLTNLICIIIIIQDQMGTVCKHGPITNQAGGNYVTSALDRQFLSKYR